jgi:hypothetical protein
MDIMKSFIPNTNGAVLQYMDVEDEGWITIGENKPGIEWYNSSDLANKPGGSPLAWGLNVFNPDKQWVKAVHDLDQVAAKPGVTFRILLTSTGAQGIGNQGFAFNNVSISERSKISILEHFTNSAENLGPAADNLIDSLGESYTGDIISLQYHMDYPGFDPMNFNNPVPATTRSFHYGIPDVPFAVLDGGISELYRYGFSDLKSTPILDNIGLGTLEKPDFDIGLKVDWKEDSLYTTTTVRCIRDDYSEYILLYVVVLETSVSAYTGANGDTLFKNVVLDMLPTPAGKLLSSGWEFGNTDTVTNNWAYQPYVEDLDDLAVVAFVQDRKTGKILQAAVNYKDELVDLVEIPELSQMRMYPNPARDVMYVNVGSTTQADGVIRILDLNGRLVHTEAMPAGQQIYQLDVHNLTRGMYVLQWMESGHIRGIEKFVKTR